MMPDINYIIYGCSYARTAPGVSLTIQELNTGGKILAAISQNRITDDNLKRQIKNWTLYNCRLFLLTKFFQYTSNWSNVF